MLWKKAQCKDLYRAEQHGFLCSGVIPESAQAALAGTAPSPAAASDFPRLSEGEHPQAGQPLRRTIVIPVPAHNVEQDLDFGLARVDFVTHYEGLKFPVISELVSRSK